MSNTCTWVQSVLGLPPTLGYWQGMWSALRGIRGSEGEALVMQRNSLWWREVMLAFVAESWVMELW